MAAFRVEGGRSLKGTLIPQGAKNEALQILCAVLLTPEEVIIRNIPDIHDVNALIDLLQCMGVTVKKIDQAAYSFKAADIDIEYLLSPEYSQKAASLRGSIMIVGPLLSRFGKGYIPRPGGDKIGRRRLDTHFQGFKNLGATFEYDDSARFFKVEATELKGSYMLLDEASVTGTANILMAASMAKGTTTIYHAACEPYVQQLCLMLKRMGAKISGIGSNLLSIEGVDYLNGCVHTILPDMIEVGSFIGLAAMTHSEITIKITGYNQLGLIPEAFSRLGIRFERKQDDIYIPAQESYEIE
ncbi:MAG: UDP-N-acetylglucosamine 1-carboxyvinyltransferase, partial [Bacteroidota bacterium]